MPAKAHRPGGLGRQHTRSSSGGSSSKLGLNLQLTQKDPLPARVSDKGKKSAPSHHELAARVARIPRSSSGIHVHSRENLQPPVLRRAPSPNTAGKQNGKAKADFTISSPDEGEDDEWISSESGAATPNNESDAQTTPVEQASQQLGLQPAPVPQAKQTAAVCHDAATPKAVSSLPRVDTARPSRLPLAPTSRDYALREPHAGFSSRQMQREAQGNAQRPQLEIHISSPTPPVNKARSETHSPPRRSPDAVVPKSMTRPPSTHSIASPVLRPHPLIRGPSYGQNVLAAKPVPLTPLTSVVSDAASGQMTTSSSSPTSLRASSPTSIRTLSASPNLPSPSSTSSAHKQLRRTSTSSVASSATMPIQSAASERFSTRSNHDRHRTLSTISSSSSIAALANFALRSAPSPPRTPLTMTSTFPPQEQSAVLESIHPLLPPPYSGAHIALLRTGRDPILESYERVIRAKPQMTRMPRSVSSE